MQRIGDPTIPLYSSVGYPLNNSFFGNFLNTGLNGSSRIIHNPHFETLNFMLDFWIYVPFSLSDEYSKSGFLFHKSTDPTGITAKGDLSISIISNLLNDTFTISVKYQGYDTPYNFDQVLMKDNWIYFSFLVCEDNETISTIINGDPVNIITNFKSEGISKNYEDFFISSNGVNQNTGASGIFLNEIRLSNDCRDFNTSNIYFENLFNKN